MIITTKIVNEQGTFKVSFKTGEKTHSIDVPPKTSGLGSDVNGGEFLFLALAACYCNDVYREASKMNLKITNVEVEVKGEFSAEGEPAKNVIYNVKVAARADKEKIIELINHTDKVTEIQNTVRTVVPVKLGKIEAVPV